MELTPEQKKATRFWFREERPSAGHFKTILARLCIRNLRQNPKLDKNEKLFSLLYDGLDTFIDLWGCDCEESYYAM